MSKRLGQCASLIQTYSNAPASTCSRHVPLRDSSGHPSSSRMCTTEPTMFQRISAHEFRFARVPTLSLVSFVRRLFFGLGKFGFACLSSTDKLLFPHWPQGHYRYTLTRWPYTPTTWCKHPPLSPLRRRHTAFDHRPDRNTDNRESLNTPSPLTVHSLAHSTSHHSLTHNTMFGRPVVKGETTTE